MGKVWAIKFPGKPPFQLRDLPIESIDAIAKKHDVSWATVLDGPLMEVPVSLDLTKEVASRLEDVKVSESYTARELIGLFDLVEDDLPTEFADSVPPQAVDPSTHG
jgi:hypothetical protein